MKINFIKLTFLLCAMVVAGFSSQAQFSIAATGTDYTQNFDGLASTGTANTWANNTTLSGWYARTTNTASVTAYAVNTGSTTTAGLYSFGVAGVNAITERSLAFVASNTYTGTAGAGISILGYRLVNNTGSAISSITVTYTGEQYRKENNALAHNINVDYQTGSTVTDPIAGTWTAVPALTFASPIIGATAATVIDGNAAANRATLTTTITVSIPAGQEIMIRFTDVNDSGNDHFMAIDDVTVNATAAAATSLSATTLTAFGSQCINAGPYGPNMFTITGSNLDGSNVTVAALSGFEYATTSGGPYSSSLSLTAAAGAYSQDIYVRFNPITAISYNGNIVVGGGGASSINVAAAGTGIDLSAPTIGSPSATATASDAVLSANITATNCSAVTIRGFEYSLVNNFGVGTGTQITETGTFSTGSYSLNATGLAALTTYYFRGFAVNGVDTTYTTQATFATSLNVGDITFLGYNSGGVEDFSFVTWVDLPVGTKIKFTDNGFHSTNAATFTGIVPPNASAGNGRGGEGLANWTNTTASTIPAGSVIRMTVATATPSEGTQVNANALALAGADQIFAYMGAGAGTTVTNSDFGGNGNPSVFTGTVLHGLNYGNAGWLTTGTASANASYLPSELNVANGNIILPSTAVAAQYTGTRSALGNLNAYKALVNNPANWTTSGTSLTLDLTDFTVNPNPATQILAGTVNGGNSPSVLTPFDVTFSVLDASNNAAAVGVDTQFQLSVFTGTGVLSGTTTITVTAGSGSGTFTGVQYNVAEAGVVFQISAISGDVLTSANTAATTVLAAASQMAFTNVVSFGYTNNVITTFNVEARRPDNSLDANVNGQNVTIALISGTGAITGTLVKPFVNGVATFNDISFDASGAKQLEATSYLLNMISPNITISTPVFTEVILPQYIQGVNGTNSNRVPYAYRATLSGLQPNTTFNYINSVVDGTDAANSNGAGNAIYANSNGIFTQAGPTSLSTPGGFGTFTTDNTGAFTGWFITEPTGNARFTPANLVRPRIILNNGFGGTFAAVRLTSTNTVEVRNLGTTASSATALRGNSLATASNFIVAYDNEAGTGRPIAATMVESDGSANQSSIAAFYATNVDGVAGAYGMVIPNTLPNGIRRLEQRTRTTGALITCPVTDADGIWPSGANTVNPNTGTTAIVITQTDASFDPAQVEICGNEVDDDCDGLIDEGCPAPAIANDSFSFAFLAPNSGSAYPAGNCYNATLVGTNVSPSGTTANVLPTGGQDVWYKFVATSPASRVVCTTSGMNVVLELHDALGAEVDFENAVSNNTGGEIMVTNGLTVGNTYYVAVRSYDGTLSSFSVCIQTLRASTCADGDGTYDLCSNFKATYAGANNYTFTFTPTGATPGGVTSVTAASQVSLSSAVLGLRHAGTYDVVINANFTLVDAAGNDESITVVGFDPCSIVIAPHADLRTKDTQRCPATVLKGTYLQAKPFVCAAVNHTIEFTEVTDCTGSITIGAPFTTTTSSASANRWLQSVGGVQSGKWYSVRWRPNFAYGAGSFGTPDVIYVAGSASEEVEMNVVSEMEAAISLYPNPNSGEMLNINITDADGIVAVRMIDMMGKVVYSDRFVAEGSLNQIVSFNNRLAKGMYMVEMTIDGVVTTKRLVVQ